MKDNVGISDKDYKIGIFILGLTCWASLSLMFMIYMSWVAANWNWVAILAGLLCFSASLAIYAWKAIVLDQDNGGEDDGGI